MLITQRWGHGVLLLLHSDMQRKMIESCNLNLFSCAFCIALMEDYATIPIGDYVILER